MHIYTHPKYEVFVYGGSLFIITINIKYPIGNKKVHTNYSVPDYLPHILSGRSIKHSICEEKIIY